MSRSIGLGQRRVIIIIHAEGVSLGNGHVFRDLDLIEMEHALGQESVAAVRSALALWQQSLFPRTRWVSFGEQTQVISR